MNEYRAVVEEALAAIDIPHAATMGDTAARSEVLTLRCIELAVSLRSILDRPDDIAARLAYLRDRLAEHPTDTYTHWADRNRA